VPDETTDGDHDRLTARPRDWGSLYLKGIAMGAADTVPGVSGGTIALITGVYERLVTAIAALDPSLLVALGVLHRADGRQQFVASLRERDVHFLVVLGLGVVTAVLALSRVIHAALGGYPGLTFAFFFGLIAASAVVLYGELSVDTAGAVAATVVGFALAYFLSGTSAAGGLPHDLPFVFLTGAIAITAMILPGVSGSFLLLLFGQYEYLTGVLTRFVDGLIRMASGGGGSPGTEGIVVAVFLTGAVLGVLSVARAIRWALDSYRRATLAFLVSLMVGSLRLPVREVDAAVGTWTPVAAAAVLAPAVVGAGAVLVLDHYTSDLEL
jgi:putative membrane protein